MSSSARTLGISAIAALVLTAVAVFFFLNSSDGPGRTDAPDGAVSERSDPAGGPSSGDRLPGRGGADNATATGTTDEAAVVEVPKPTGPLSLSGRVVHGDEGIAGARVTAFDASRWRETVEEVSVKLQRGPPNYHDLRRMLEQSFGGRVKKLAEVATGDDGGFAFHGLRTGEYRLWVTHPDFLPSDDTVAIVGEGAPDTVEIALTRAAVVRGRAISAESGEPLAGVAVRAQPDYRHVTSGIGRFIQVIFAEMEGAGLQERKVAKTDAKGAFELRALEPVPHTFTLARAGYVAAVYPKIVPDEGEVTFALHRGVTLTARLVDADSMPLPGARWQLKPKLEGDIDSPMAMAQQEFDVYGEKNQTGVTDADGKFAAAGLETRVYTFRAEAEGLAPLAIDITPDPAANDLGDLAFQRARALRGQVLDEAGEAIAGARVWLESKQRENPFEETESVELEVRSDDIGEFTLGPVGNGVQVRAEAEGYVRSPSREPDFETESFDFRLAVGKVVLGRVVDGESEEPIEGVRITTYLNRDQAATVTDAEGFFEIGGIASAHSAVHATFLRAGYGRRGEQLTPLDPDEIDEEAPTVIRLDRFREIVGTVTNEAGEPVRHARVGYEVPGMPPFLLLIEGGGVPGPALTRGDGTFSTQLPAGPGRMEEMLELVVSHSRYAPAHVRVKDIAGEEDPIEIEVSLTKGASLVGRVTREDGTPLARAQLRLERAVALKGEALMFAMMAGPQTGSIAYTSADGDYSYAGLEAGRYKLSAYALGLAPLSLVVEVAETGETRQDVTLQEGLRLSGRVVDPDGVALSGIEVVLFEQPEGAENRDGFDEEMILFGGRGSRSTRSDTDGEFLLSNLEDTDYVLVVRHATLPPLVQFGVRPGRLGDVVLEGFAALQLRVIAADNGEAVQEYRVNIRQTERSGMRIRWQNPDEVRDPDGRYSRGELPAGRYNLGIDAPGFVAHAEEIELAGGAPKEQTIRLERGLGLTVVVVEDETQRPIAEASVHAGSVSESGAEARERQRLQREKEQRLRRVGIYDKPSKTDARGVYVFDSLEDGTYHINASHAGYYMAPRKREKGEEGRRSNAVVLPADAGKEVVIPMLPAGQVKGKVSGLPGRDRDRRVSRQLVFARFDEESGQPKQTRSVWIQDSGDFHATSLQPGSYRVSLKIQQHGKPDGRSAQPEQETTLLEAIEVLAGSVEKVELEAPADAGR